MPTWGVSFGLPQSGGGYPINSYGGEPLVNPYPGYGSGSQGINLGLVSVNPLVSVQVTKDDYGEKVVKPFVNLHVTPNQGLVHKFHNLLANKKQLLHGDYHHNYAPNYYPPGPSHYERPIFVDKPFHQQYYPNHGPNYQRPQYNYHDHHHFYHQKPYNQGNYGHGYYRGDDYDENNFGDYGDYDGYYRSARTNNSFESSRDINDGNQQTGDENYSSRENQRNEGDVQGGKVAFPSRRRREVEEVRFEECL